MKSYIKYNIVPVTILLLSSFQLLSQGKFSVSTGYGYYEQVNLGVHWNISGSSSLSVFGGTNFNLNDRMLITTGLSFSHSFAKPVVWKLFPGYSFGAYFWTSDDDLYYFSALGFPAMAMITWPVSDVISLRAEGGGIANAVLASDRKQNLESGYPARFNGTFRLSVIFKLIKNEK